MTLGDEEFTKKKNRTKWLRTVLEILVVLGLLYLVWETFFHQKTYEPFTEDEVSATTDTGFIALSYFGVDRIGDTSTLIGEKQLREHLQALKDEGYVTITHEDIENYYERGTPLPDKSMYLMFEDGRRDTAIFADNILEDLNFKGVMMSYPEKFDHEDPKFLRPDDLKSLTDSTFWELGTNGYRLEYINVYDRYHNFIGELDPLTYNMMRAYLGRDYNHYLMDYIRDKDRIPTETLDHMKRRVGYDYSRLRELYQAGLGYVPPVYVLMHSNTGKFGNALSVSRENEKWIRELFTINFNREGYSFNKRDSSLYDLTRMQPQPYWPVNHLLMRIKYDTHQDVTFKKGDARMAEWNILKGAAQYKEESIIVTSLPEGEGLLRLKNRSNYKDVTIKVRLEGNTFGGQKVLFRGNKDFTSYLAAGIEQGKLVLTMKKDGKEEKLFEERLSVLDGIEPVSIEEDKKNVREGVLSALTRYASTTGKAKAYVARLEATKDQKATSVKEGDEEYIATESFHSRLDRELEVRAKGHMVSLFLDGKQVADVRVESMEGKEIGLQAGWDSNAWSQRNLADDVYDGVFERLIITTPLGSSDSPIYSTELTGMDKWKFDANQKWEAVLGWFLNHF